MFQPCCNKQLPIDNKKLPQRIAKALNCLTFSAVEKIRTVQHEYFQHLESYLRIIESIIQDLNAKGFIKGHQ